MPNCHVLNIPIFAARRSYASAVLVTVILFVCLFVTRVLCDEMKEHTADILIPHELELTLVFWYVQSLVGDVPFLPKFALKLTHPFEKNANFDQYLLITSQPSELAKNVYLSWIGSQLRAFQRAIDEERTLTITPQRVAQIANLSFLWIKSATKFLCVKIPAAQL